MYKLLAFFSRNEVSFTFFPAGLKVNQSADQVSVVLELRVHTFDVLLVLAEQLPQLRETLPYAFRQLPHGLRLAARYATTNAFGLEQDLDLQVVAAFAVRVGDGVDLVDDVDELLAVFIIIGALDHDLALGALAHLGRGDLFFDVDGLLDVAARVLLDEHQLDDVEFFVLDPVFVELF